MLAGRRQVGRTKGSGRRDVAGDLVEPETRPDIGGHPPVAARRQGTARNHLRAVWEGTALELVRCETPHENLQPVTDCRQVVGVTVLFGKPRGPAAGSRVTPGVMCQERDPARTVDCGTSPGFVGISSGVISVSSTDISTRFTSSSNCPEETTQRIRCWIRVFGTPAFTL